MDEFKLGYWLNVISLILSGVSMVISALTIIGDYSLVTIMLVVMSVAAFEMFVIWICNIKN